MNTAHPAEHSGLGKPSIYAGHYDPSRLFPIARSDNRAKLGLGAELPFHGIDLWNAYELSWLDTRGKPHVALASISVPATTPCLIESKSLKLYLNGFMQTRMESQAALQSCISSDLSAAAGGQVEVLLQSLQDPAVSSPGSLPGECIDTQELDIEHYQHPRAEMLRADTAEPISECLVSHLLKSNCPVTGQPDWASLQIDYQGPRLDRAALLRYLIAFREHAEFHEHCVEQIFCDLWRSAQPQRLSVYARYTRRGGIDINPFRSSEPGQRPPNPRLPRQ